MGRLAFIAVCLLLLAGCAPTVNPDHLVRNRQDFNTAVVRSWDEQMLLNLVRLRYRDTPMFLEVGSVVGYQSVKTNGTVSAGLDNDNDPPYTAGVGASREVTMAPTVTYTPLQGEEFARRFLTPIPPSTIFLLSQSGWSLSRLMLTCVQEANGVRNAPSASGPTPEYVPVYAEFRKASDALRTLQLDRQMLFEADSSGRTVTLHLRHDRTPRSDSATALFAGVFGLDPKRESFRIALGNGRGGTDELLLSTRSLLSALFFLSQSVEVPEEHERRGVVTVTRSADGSKFDWSEVTGGVMRIRSGADEPKEAAVKVSYRGVWFYIDDTDLNSKTTFSLLSFLFNLQSANRPGAAPVMTFPVR